MTTYLPTDKAHLLDEFRRLPNETEWLEFKENNHLPQQIGEYLSALSNSARLKRRPAGYLIYGIEDGTHAIKGTVFRPHQAKGKGNEGLIPWLTRGLDPRVRVDVAEGAHQEKHVVIFEVSASAVQPVKFYGQAFVRVGSSKNPLNNHPELERRLWGMGDDWSAQPCPRATYHHLDSEALAKARLQFKNKHPRQANEIADWDDRKFLTKARVAVEGELTNAAILLLGKEESEPLLAPGQAWLRWSLKKADGGDENYEDFRTPLLLSVDRLFTRVRNLRVRYLPDGTLFPVEVDQYDAWVIREALHNAIAHQDYALRGRILIVEKPDEIVFANLGEFIPGSVEIAIREDIPPRLYRNPWLCQAMVNLGMIDSQGGGIRRMFLEQKKRCFPLPEYDLSHSGEVRVRILGKVIDSYYTQLLIRRPDLELETVMLLDRVQKGVPLSREQYDSLRKQRLVEGRWKAYHIAAQIAAQVDAKAEYVRTRGLDTKHYEALVIEYLRKFDAASREDIDRLLLDKLPQVLDNSQKANKIHNILGKMNRARKIRNVGSRKAPQWILALLIDEDAKKKT